MTQDSRQQAILDVGKAIKATRVAMFTTRTVGNQLQSRPLHTRDTEFDGELWFFTDRNSMKVDEIKANPLVNLAYANSGDGTYLSVEGHAQVVRDQARIDALWSESIDSLFFKGGKTDPDLVLIKVVCESAELWTSASTSIGRAYKFLKAKATGNITDLGQHRHVELKH